MAWRGLIETKGEFAMSEHHHSHHHAGHGHGHGHPARKPFHKDWRLWAVVALMLLGIVVYVLTLDESVRP